MPGNTIGNAYVQILPSMDGFSGALNKGAQPAGKEVGSMFSTNFVGTAVKVIGAAGIGKVIQSSISEGGKLQQSMGGIETLFKSSADKVKKNAEKSWKTVGMSANEYMENTTSFAASLISSTSGNTKEAARLADMAMKDMSDNANKMGTDLASVTGTYQSIARGNYQMLDNLKLGYGGTKTEMQRLMADAEKLTGEKYSVGDFGDTVKAIHAIQDSLGITGTTAKEAQTTLSGSMNMMKSAWTDFLGQVSMGGDLSAPINNLSESMVTAAQNIIPMFTSVITSIPNIVSGFGQAISQALGGQSLIEAATGLLNSLGDGIQTAMPTLAAKFLPMLVDMSATIRSGAGQMIDAGLNLVMSLADGLIASLPTLIETVPTIITNIAGIINDNAPKLLITGGALIIKLGMGIIQAIPTIIQNIPKIIGAIIAVWTAFNWVSLGKSIVTGIPKALKALPSKMAQAGRSAINAIKGVFTGGGSGLIASVRGLFAKIPALVKTQIGKAPAILRAAISKMRGALKFSWSLPHLKLPKISVSGGKSPYGLGGKGSLPKFSLKWNKEGGIFDRASIIGYGVGEAGQEAIMPLDRFWDKMDELKNSMQSNGGGGDLTLYINLDGATIAKSTISYINGQTVRYNASPLYV